MVATMLPYSYMRSYVVANTIKSFIIKLLLNKVSFYRFTTFGLKQFLLLLVKVKPVLGQML